MKKVKVMIEPKFLKDFVDNKFEDFIQNANSTIDFHTKYKQFKDRELDSVTFIEPKHIKVIENHRAAYGNSAFQILEIAPNVEKAFDYFQIEMQEA